MSETRKSLFTYPARLSWVKADLLKFPLETNFCLGQIGHILFFGGGRGHSGAALGSVLNPFFTYSFTETGEKVLSWAEYLIKIKLT